MVEEGRGGEDTDLDDATDEDVVALVDSVLQHHFVHHGNKDLVLCKQTNKGPFARALAGLLLTCIRGNNEEP